MTRKPDYRVTAMIKDTEKKGNIGAAWKNEDGSIDIRLDAFVSISSHPDLRIKLFPPEWKPKKKGKPPSSDFDDAVDNTPF